MQALAEDKSFDFSYLLTRRPPWAPSVLAWRNPPATAEMAVLPNPNAVCPSPKWIVVLPALLCGFPKEMCAQSWSWTLCPRQEPEGPITVKLSSGAARIRVELELHFLGVLKSGLSLPGRTRTAMWGREGPVEAERVDVG